MSNETIETVAVRIRKALEPFVHDSDYVQHRFAVINNHSTCDDDELVETFQSFDEAVRAWERLVAKDPQSSLSISGQNHGILASHHQVFDLFASPSGTFECPICGIDTPHTHTQTEVEADRKANVRLQRMRDKDRAEILSRVSNVDKLYGQRPQLDEAVAAVMAAILKSDELQAKPRTQAFDVPGGTGPSHE